MTVNFDSNALRTFSKAEFASPDSISNLNEDGSLKSNGTYSRGNIFRFLRSADTKAANNAVRTELLQSLGRAFGLDGISNKDGKVTFSKDFMDNLEKLLGPAFKRSDFGVDSCDGSVTSGKPLTSRRISAIVKQAVLVGKGDFKIENYREKFKYLQQDLAAKQDIPYRESVIKYFNSVEKAIQFMENELDSLLENNDELMDVPQGKDGRFIIKMNDDFILLDSLSTIDEYILEKVKRPIHIQLNITSKSISKLSDIRELDQIKNYISNVLQTFIKTSVDLYYKSQNAGKFQEFMKLLGTGNPCIEGKNSEMTAFALNYIPMEDVAADNNADAVQTIPDKIIDHDISTPLHICIMKEMEPVFDKNPNAENWKDFAADIKSKLVGLKRPIMTTEIINGELSFKNLTDNNGNPVVRNVTAEDIEALGEACINSFYGD